MTKYNNILSYPHAREESIVVRRNRGEGVVAKA
jgi:hypothetical protein